MEQTKTFTKNWPDNSHMDYYSSEIGWVYLGSDDKNDYYVNHVKKWTSIVYGEEPWQYATAQYPHVVSRESYLLEAYPYSQLIHFLNEEVTQL